MTDEGKYSYMSADQPSLRELSLNQKLETAELMVLDMKTKSADNTEQVH